MYEFGFDYLRDNMKYSREAMVQRPFNYAIVDEVDSSLVDEARTPLILSGPTEDKSEMRSEERGAGNEWVSTCRYGRSDDQKKKQSRRLRIYNHEIDKKI